MKEKTIFNENIFFIPWMGTKAKKAVSDNPFKSITYNSTAIRTKKLQSYANDCEMILHWCDYISTIIPVWGYSIRENRLFSISNDTNSNQKLVPLNGYGWENTRINIFDPNWDFWDFTITWTNNWSTENVFHIWVNFRGAFYNLFRFSFYNENSNQYRNNKTQDRLDIYWAAWRLFNITGWSFSPLNVLSYLLSNNEEDLENLMTKSHITRFDYRIDFFTKKWDRGLRHNEIFERTRKKLESFKAVWDVKAPKSYYRTFELSAQETGNFWVLEQSGNYYTWRSTVKQRSNRDYISSRFYHKQADIYAKENHELYSDYLEHPGEVWRFEIEANSNFCSARGKVSLADELISNKLSDRMFEYLGIREKTGYFSKPYIKEEIHFDHLSKPKQEAFLKRWLSINKKALKEIPLSTLKELWQNNWLENYHWELKYAIEQEDPKELWDIGNIVENFEGGG